MPDDLKTLSNEELWRLFPISLSEYDPNWSQFYKMEGLMLEKMVGKENIVRINHIGSTAVRGLIAKPTVDILLEVKECCNLDKLVAAMEKSGYIHSPQPGNPPPHMMFLKGYTPRGFEGRAFHVHVRYSGDWPELYFRDYLRVHPDSAEQYGALKTTLMVRHQYDRDGYTNAKSEFVKKYTELAKREFGGRYKPAVRQGRKTGGNEGEAD